MMKDIERDRTLHLLTQKAPERQVPLCHILRETGQINMGPIVMKDIVLWASKSNTVMRIIGNPNKIDFANITQDTIDEIAINNVPVNMIILIDPRYMHVHMFQNAMVLDVTYDVHDVCCPPNYETVIHQYMINNL